MERRESLWWLAAGPATWFAHFLLSYGTAAVLCVKISAPMHTVRVAIAIYTLLALAAVVFIARRSRRQQRTGGANRPPYDQDTAQARHRFLGLATLLLSGLSFVAIVYVALVPVFIGDCR